MTQLMKMMDLEQFDKIAFTVRTHCVICDSKFSDAVINLPQFPLTEIYVEEKITRKLGYVDQKFHLCKSCGHGQLANLVDKSILYGHCYNTRTSISPSAMGALDVFMNFIENVIGNRKFKTLLEVGCNDLHFLNRFKSKADKLYGIDPILKDRENELADEKITLIGDFFENVDLKSAGIKADIIFSSHTFEHVERPAELIEKLVAAAADDSVFFFQFPGFESLVKDARFDQMYHQHLNYFSARSVQFLLEKLGVELIDMKVNPYHWGALMVAFKKGKPKVVTAALISESTVTQQYDVFKKCMQVTANRLASAKDEAVYGFGAAMMLPVLDYYIPGLRQLRNIIDDDKTKENLYYLNFPVQIKTTKDIPNIENSVVVLTAIYSLTTQRAIMKRLIDLKVKQIILPINII